MKRKSFDWEAIGREYRAGQLSIREIGRQHGCAESYIRKVAKKEGWKRDLTKAIKEQVRNKMVRNTERTPSANQSEATDKEIVKEYSDRAVAVLNIQRKDVGELGILGQALREELKALTCNKEDFEELAEALCALETKQSKAKKNGKDRITGIQRQIEAIQKVLSLPERAKVFQSLCNSIAKLIPLERQSYNLEDNPDGEALDSLTEILRNVAGATRGLPNRNQHKIES
jgi:hypothetical protein